MHSIRHIHALWPENSEGRYNKPPNNNNTMNGQKLTDGLTNGS